MWVGSNVFRGVYGALLPSIAMMAYMFALVVLSDMVTFWLGRALRHGMFAPLQQRLMRDHSQVGNSTLLKLTTVMVNCRTHNIRVYQMLQDATSAITKWSMWIGLVQRFTLGFPLCLACGFFGVGQLRFSLGVLAGSVLTLVLQV